MAATQPASSTDYDYEYDEGIDNGDINGGDVSGSDSRDDINHSQEPPLHHNQNHQLVPYNDGSDGSGGPHPHYMTGSFRGKPCSYYVNGDKFFNAKKLVVNPKYFRDMSHYMDHLTDKLNPNFGAIRKIHTPHNGTRVFSVNELQPGESYVAAGSEKFRRIG